jgi:hypothetical protein
MDKKEKLYELKNYNKRLLIKNISNYITQYIELINEFILHATEIIQVQDHNYYLFVFQRGIDTLKHIFKFLLLYTRNIDLTMHHCKKAYLYYIEFISQIGEDNNSFLQLNSKDATLFVYKKTIFDLNNAARKNFNQVKNEKKCLAIVDNIIEIYNKLILMSLYSMDCDELKNNKSMIIMIEKESTKIMNKIFLNNLYTNDLFCKKIKEFLYLIEMKNIEVYKKKINIIYIFVKKLIINQKIDINLIKEKMCENICDEKIENLTALKFINWLLNSNQKRF